MSRIEAGECEHMDMEWYGIDRQGNIAVFCSGGEGDLPEFVCENVERADELMEYFDKFERITDSVVVFMIQWLYLQSIKKGYKSKIWKQYL